MGSPEFALPSLRAVVGAGHDVAMVYTQPPRRAGRGRRLRETAVHVLAEELGIPVQTPESLRPAEVREAFAALEADVAVVAAYGLILPKAVLEAPTFGCINVHPSLLPRWRGAAPIQRALMAGDRETGVCIMQMDRGMDTGPVIDARQVCVEPGTTAGDLHDALAELGARAVVDVLARLEDLQPVAQAEDGVTYAPKISKNEAEIDFDEPASDVLAHIHGLSPFPGAFFRLEGDTPDMRYKVFRAELGVAAVPDGTRPGSVICKDMTIACGGGTSIRPTELQPSYKKRMSIDTFIRGRSVDPGTRVCRVDDESGA